MQEPARPPFSFLSPVNSSFCCSQLQVFRSEASCLLQLANQVPFLLGFEYFPLFFLLPFSGVFHSVQPNPLVAKQWLMALLALQRERVHNSPGAADLPNHLPVTHLPPVLLPLHLHPMQHPPITQPFSEVI